MFRKFIGIALTFAALVALGGWANDTFFPNGDGAVMQAVTERMERMAWPAAEAKTVEADSQPPTATPQASSRIVAPVASSVNADTARTEAAIVPAAALPSSSPKPSTASPRPSAKPTPIPAQTVDITLEPTPMQTAEITPSPTPATEIEAPVFERMDSEYIDSILRGLNERRAANGLPPLSLNTSISQKAQAHAMNMAKEGGGWFHLRAGMIEDSNYHHISDAPSTIGARASEHAPELCMGERITEDDSAIVTAKVVSVGIGAVRRGDRVYVCLLGEDSVTFEIKATPEPPPQP